MNSEPWQTNAIARAEDFIARQSLDQADAQAIAGLVRRLLIDPFDVPARRDPLGEWHCRLGPSSTRPGNILAVTYQIDRDYRYVNVISFEIYRDRSS